AGPFDSGPVIPLAPRTVDGELGGAARFNGSGLQAFEASTRPSGLKASATIGVWGSVRGGPSGRRVATSQRRIAACSEGAGSYISCAQSPPATVCPSGLRARLTTPAGN